MSHCHHLSTKTLNRYLTVEEQIGVFKIQLIDEINNYRYRQAHKTLKQLSTQLDAWHQYEQSQPVSCQYQLADNQHNVIPITPWPSDLSVLDQRAKSYVNAIKYRSHHWYNMHTRTQTDKHLAEQIKTLNRLLKKLTIVNEVTPYLRH